MTVEYHVEARKEFEQADAYYETRCRGLGKRFVASVREAVSRLETSPTLFPILEEDIRRCLLHSFPYGVLYTVEKNCILILAVMHLGREPEYWKKRL